MQNTPCNFKIPADYERLFLFMMGDCKYVIVVNKDGINSGGTGKIPNGPFLLNFIEESMGQIRYECESKTQN